MGGKSVGSVLVVKPMGLAIFLPSCISSHNLAHFSFAASLSCLPRAAVVVGAGALMVDKLASHFFRHSGSPVASSD
jgi:hypothetical protein